MLGRSQASTLRGSSAPEKALLTEQRVANQEIEQLGFVGEALLTSSSLESASAGSGAIWASTTEAPAEVSSSVTR